MSAKSAVLTYYVWITLENLLYEIRGRPGFGGLRKIIMRFVFHSKINHDHMLFAEPDHVFPHCLQNVLFAKSVTSSCLSSILFNFRWSISYRCFKPLQTIFHGCYVNEVVSSVNVANVSFDVNENVAFSGFASIFGHCVNNFCTINKVPSLQVAELWFRKLD